MSCPWVTARIGELEFFVFEASRSDASAAKQGAATGPACSKGGVLPWTVVTVEQARQACSSAGFRLCTEREHQLLCGGQQLWPHPYGKQEQPGSCNDFLASSSGPQPSGARGACRSPAGAFDAVGNVWEWVEPAAGEAGGSTGKPCYVGGSWKVTAMSRMLHPTRCDSKVAPVDPTVYAADDVGFRCCRQL